MAKNDQYHVAAFYRFVPLPDYKALRQPLKDFCVAQGMCGSILLAEEGINATIAGSADSIRAFFAHLDEDPRLKAMEHKLSYTSDIPFKRMKVRLKKEIVRMGVKGFDVTDTGEYAEAEEWEKLLADPEAIVIDTRNGYEVAIGTFRGAVNPHTEDFQQFPKWADEHLDPVRHKKIAMFCTGGIRCEKSTAYLKSRGFGQVYHLKGGILQYLEDTANAGGWWQGECFVFDDRIAVGSDLKPTGATVCKSCGVALPKDVTCILCMN